MTEQERQEQDQSDEKIVAIHEGIDFNQPILDLNDDPVQSTNEDGDDEDLRLGNVCCQALMASMQDDKADGTQKLKRFNLARKIKGSSDSDDFPTVRLNSKQKKMILDQAEKLFVGALFYSRIYEALEGSTQEEDD